MPACSICLSKFKTEADVARHQAQAPQCSEELRRLEQARLESLAPQVYNYESDSDPELGEHDYFDVIRGSSPFPEDFLDFPTPPSPLVRPPTPPSDDSPRLPRTAPVEPEPADEDTFVRWYPGAARVTGTTAPPLSALFAEYLNPDNLYAPFASEEEWSLARWAKLNATTDSSFNELLEIQGLRTGMNLSFKNAKGLNKLVDSLPNQATFKHSTISVEGFDDTYDLFACNPLDVLRELLGDPTYKSDLEFVPRQCFEDEGGQNRLYHEMFSGNFTWEMQKRLPIGAAQLPIIIGSDKTQLTNFSGEHAAYPVYMSIGNIAKHVRAQPSKRAFRLVAYLPTLKPDETMMSEARARVLRNRLFHKAMEMVFEPLFSAAAAGISIADSEGNLRLCFPILASYVADYPEQCLVTGVRYGQTCPKCHITVDEFGAHKLGEPRVQQQSYEVVDDARAAPTAAAEKERLQQAGLNNIKPFYARWPHADMHRAQSPDCLHQVVQGVGAHLLDWLTAIMGAEELDARLARLPPAHNLRNFARGISGLSRVSGSERKAIYAQLLGGIVGRAPKEAVQATRALIDFIYIVQFQCHSTDTLESLKTALDDFHKHKHIFQQYKPGLDFNFPKMHMLEHYASDICSIGTTDNTNTEITERMHIESAKNAFRASNRADYIVQMCRWLQRRYAIHFFAVHLACRQGITYDARKRPPKALQRSPVALAKVAPCPRQKIATLEVEHGFTGLKKALKTFLEKWHGVSYRFYEGELPDRVVRSLALLEEVAVWYCVKFYTPNMQSFHAPDYHDIARCTPQRATKAFRGRIVRRFDTIMVETRGNGVAGQGGLKDIRIARLRAVFRIPTYLEQPMFGDNPPAHLALVEWFNRPTQRDADSALYKISRSFTRDKEVELGIIEVIDIRRSCHLFPRYGPEPVDRRLTSNTVLDVFNDFLLNDAVDKHAYDTIY